MVQTAGGCVKEVSGRNASLGQGKRLDEELIVIGTGECALCETVTGFAAVYDDFLERFCYARLLSGVQHSTGVPVTSPPPPDILRTAKNRARTAGAGAGMVSAK